MSSFTNFCAKNRISSYLYTYIYELLRRPITSKTKSPSLSGFSLLSIFFFFSFFKNKTKTRKQGRSRGRGWETLALPFFEVVGKLFYVFLVLDPNSFATLKNEMNEKKNFQHLSVLFIPDFRLFKTRATVCVTLF